MLDEIWTTLHHFHLPYNQSNHFLGMRNGTGGIVIYGKGDDVYDDDCYDLYSDEHYDPYGYLGWRV